MYFRDMNEAARAGMVKEIRFDIAPGALYESGRLSAKGRTDWPDLLIGAYGLLRRGPDSTSCQHVLLRRT